MNGSADAGRWLFRVGDHFIVVRDRRGAVSGGTLREAFDAAPSLDARRQLLDCEVSWGRWAGGSAPRIVASTLPFRENQTLAQDPLTAADGIRWSGEHWRIVESSFGSAAEACRWLADRAQ